MKTRLVPLLALLAIAVLPGCRREKNGPVVPKEATLTTDVTSLSFEGAGGTKTFSVTSNAEWKAEAGDEWILLDREGGSGDATVSVTVGQHKTGIPREGSIRVSIAGDEDTCADITVHQESDEPDPEEKGVVIPRSAFTEATDWGLTGTVMDLNWGSGGDDLPLLGEPDYGWMAVFDVAVKDGDQFKFRKDSDWKVNLGASAGQIYIDHKYILADGGGNLKLAAGTYDLYVHPTFMLLYVEKAGDEFAHGDANAEAQESENLRIYLLNNSTWDTPYMYAYVGDAGSLQPFGSWPGTYASGTKKYGDYTYTYWEAAGFSGVGGINLILNDGKGNQYPLPDEKDPLWSNLTILNSIYFTWDGKTLTQVEEDPSKPGVTGTGTEPVEMKFGSSSWTIIGTLGGTNWDYDFPMDAEGYWEVARDVEIKAGELFKFRQSRSWSNNLGYGAADSDNAAQAGTKLELGSGGGNLKMSSAGTYDLYLSVENKLLYILAAGTEWTHEAEGKPDYVVSGAYDPALSCSSKASGLTYQVNVFSFKDSDGDGWGDFKGLTQSLDYFDRLGVTALWLSPIQPAQSYHGYDVTDYETVNTRYGTEEDFQELVTAAHGHNIRIYLDYVMNHSGDQNKWFQDVKKNGTASPYWNYYSLSKDPEADCKAGRIAQVDDNSYDKYKWYPVTIGGGGVKRYRIDLDWTSSSAPKMTVTETADAPTTSGTRNNPARYLYWGGGTCSQFYDNGTDKYTLVLDYESDWGCLVRTRNDDTWTGNSKWGFNKTGDKMVLGQPHTLYSDDNPDNVQSIVMPGGELYYYYTEFGTGMFVDFNYGEASSCKSSPAFKAIMKGVEKWLGMGVDGFRLDAVKHIYHVEAGSNNIVFWKAFYEECNKLYKENASARSGLTDPDSDIFMVGEVLSGDGDCTKFYEGLPALFEFQFWWDLRECLNNGETIWKAGYGQSFPGSLKYRWDGHRNVRSSAIATPKLANHDEDRTASTLGNYKPKIRLAAAVLLTSPGRPFIYQGEELGYWGTKSGGDEYVRTPILWTSSKTSAAVKGVSNKVDWDMLKASISVESQEEDDTSLLTLYRRFGYARNTTPALADGEPEVDGDTVNGYDGHIAGWYMHEVGNWSNAVLVLHNFSGYTIDVYRTYDNVSNDRIIVANGHVSVSGKTVTMPAYSSVVFELK